MNPAQLHRPRLRGPLLAVVSAVALGVAVSARAAEEPRVRSLRIDGTHHLSADDLKRRLATGEPGMWPWSAAMSFDPVLWEEDLRRIPRIYEARGYYGSKVVRSEIEREADGVHLHVWVEEGHPTYITAVDVVGLDDLPAAIARAARDDVRMRAGRLFLEGDWVAAKARIERTLRDHGYADATAGGTVHVDPAAHVATVMLEVRPGQRYRFGDLLLATEDAPAFPPAAVLRQARPMLPEGSWFSQSALEKAQRQLFDLGIYEAVAVTAGAAKPGSDRLPVVIDVREAPQMRLRAGAGIGSTPGRDEVRGVGEWIHRNLLGDLGSLRVAGRAGWAFVPGFTDVARGDSGPTPTRQGPFAKLTVDAAQPRRIGPAAVDAFASVELEQDLREAYEFRSARGEAGAGWRVADLLDVRASYALDLYSLYDTPLLGAGAPEPAVGCPAPCRFGYLEQELTLGRRRGSREGAPGRELTLRLREGAPALGSTLWWMSADLEAIVHVPLSSRVELASRIGASTIGSRGGDAIPIVLRLFSGGATMRGFGPRRLAPLLLVPGPGGKTQVVPTGGKGLVDGTLEVRARLGESFGVAAFLDAGAVTPESFDAALLWRAIQLSPGVGFRYRTALGPIRADVATILPLGHDLPVTQLPGVPLDPAVGRQAAETQKCCSMHISIGESF